MIKNYCKMVREAQKEEERLEKEKKQQEQEEMKIKDEEEEVAQDDSDRLRRPYLHDSEELLTSENGDLHLNPVKFTSSSDQQKSEKAEDPDPN